MTIRVILIYILVANAISFAISNHQEANKELCPKQCACFNMSVTCNNLTLASSNLPANIKKLKLINTNLQKLNLTNLTDLTNLDLSYNNATTLTEQTFTNLKQVINLNLSNNYLSDITPSTLSPLQGLQGLDLSHNDLLGPSAGAFHTLLGLTILNLSHNRDLGNGLRAIVAISRVLRELDLTDTGLNHVPEVLTHSVRVLNIGYNNIQEILDGDFDSYPLLSHLDLSHNHIHYIQDDAMGRLDMLTSLDISHNNLLQVPENLPNSLKELNLNDNQLKEIIEEDLTPLVNIQVLDLSNNHFLTLPPQTTSRSIVVLKLNNNHFRSLGENFLINFPSLEMVYAEGNNLTCEESNWLNSKIKLIGVNLTENCDAKTETSKIQRMFESMKVKTHTEPNINQSSSSSSDYKISKAVIDKNNEDIAKNKTSVKRVESLLENDTVKLENIDTKIMSITSKVRQEKNVTKAVETSSPSDVLSHTAKNKTSTVKSPAEKPDYIAVTTSTTTTTTTTGGAVVSEKSKQKTERKSIFNLKIVPAGNMNNSYSPESTPLVKLYKYNNSEIIRIRPTIISNAKPHAKQINVTKIVANKTTVNKPKNTAVRNNEELLKTPGAVKNRSSPATASTVTVASLGKIIRVTGSKNITYLKNMSTMRDSSDILTENKRTNNSVSTTDDTRPQKRNNTLMNVSELPDHNTARNVSTVAYLIAPQASTGHPGLLLVLLSFLAVVGVFGVFKLFKNHSKLTKKPTRRNSDHFKMDLLRSNDSHMDIW